MNIGRPVFFLIMAAVFTSVSCSSSPNESPGAFIIREREAAATAVAAQHEAAATAVAAQHEAAATAAAAHHDKFVLASGEVIALVQQTMQGCNPKLLNDPFEVVKSDTEFEWQVDSSRRGSWTVFDRSGLVQTHQAAC